MHKAPRLTTVFAANYQRTDYDLQHKFYHPLTHHQFIQILATNKRSSSSFLCRMQNSHRVHTTIKYKNQK